jgi:RNA polymerase sigma-70 factor (ECF subfamily)
MKSPATPLRRHRQTPAKRSARGDARPDVVVVLPPSAPAAYVLPQREDGARPHPASLPAKAASAPPPAEPVTAGRRTAAETVPDAEAIFRQHAPRLFSLARRMLGNEADVEDVVQEVLLQVVRKLDSFRGEAELTTWLHRVAVNAALLHRRKNAPRLARQVKVPLELVLERGQQPGGPQQDRPEQRVLQGETRWLIEQAIDRLPEMYRDAFVLSDIEGLSNAEIQEVLGLSLAAVKSRLHRARLLLRDALAPHFRERDQS